MIRLTWLQFRIQVLVAATGLMVIGVFSRSPVRTWLTCTPPVA